MVKPSRSACRLMASIQRRSPWKVVRSTLSKSSKRPFFASETRGAILPAERVRKLNPEISVKLMARQEVFGRYAEGITSQLYHGYPHSVLPRTSAIWVNGGNHPCRKRGILTEIRCTEGRMLTHCCAKVGKRQAARRFSPPVTIIETETDVYWVCWTD